MGADWRFGISGSTWQIGNASMKMVQHLAGAVRHSVAGLAVLLCALPAGALPFGAQPAIFDFTITDHWRDRLVGNATDGYSVSTSGECTVTAKLPMNGPEILAYPFSTNAHVELTLGGFDTFCYLRDDPNFRRGDTNVTVHENDPTTGALLATFNLSWGNGVMNVAATMNFDALGGESAYGTQGNAGVSDISDQIEFYFNMGNRVSYEDDNVNIGGENTDYEITDPLGNPQSLEVGSVTGTVYIVTPIIEIKTPAEGAVVEGTGNGKVHFSGTVAGISPLASVSYYLNGDTNNEFSIIDSFASDVRSASWSTIIDLTNNSDAMPGTNALDVVVYDIYGGWESRSRTIFYVFTNSVDLQVT